MKTVTMTREFLYEAKERVAIRYLGGATYDRVPEFAARAIVAAGAGYVVDPVPVTEIMADTNKKFDAVFPKTDAAP